MSRLVASYERNVLHKQVPLMKNITKWHSWHTCLKDWLLHFDKDDDKNIIIIIIIIIITHRHWYLVSRIGIA